MLFNSLSFLLFFPLTTAIYFLLPHRFRWIHLLACSCLFYAAFIPSYLLILGAVILIDYAAGLLIARSHGATRRLFLIVSLIANAGLLGIFKYFNFANANLHALADFLHLHYPIRNLGILLPIGLSFHTFQSMAYTIEVYRGRQTAERHLGIYSLYVMFYPQLVAGPIERPQHLLHQFREYHPFHADRIFDGLKLMLWGFFKKVVIADRLSAIVDAVYAHPGGAGGAYLILATWLFAIQIYCDFSGYTDIAIGAARVLGFRLMNNFDRPYIAQSVGEFWRRWHISLSSWFRDYLYIPLGGSRVALPRWCFNVMIVFLISGMWHGASWTFAVWGALHGIYLIVSRLTESTRRRIAASVGLDRVPALHEVLRMLVTFNLVAFAWIFFRAPTLGAAWLVLKGMAGPHFWAAPMVKVGSMGMPAFTSSGLNISLELVLLLQLAEYLRSRASGIAPSPPYSGERAGVRGNSVERRKSSLPVRRATPPLWLRWGVSYALIILILWIGALGARTFIYFQF